MTFGVIDSPKQTIVTHLIRAIGWPQCWLFSAVTSNTSPTVRGCQTRPSGRVETAMSPTR